jgi:hypothetical protein
MRMKPEEQRAILATAMKAAEVHCRATTTAIGSLLVPLIGLMRKKGALSTEELNALIIASENVGPGKNEAEAMVAIYRDLMTAYLRQGLEPTKSRRKKKG